MMWKLGIAVLAFCALALAAGYIVHDDGHVSYSKSEVLCSDTYLRFFFWEKSYYAGLMRLPYTYDLERFDNNASRLYSYANYRYHKFKAMIDLCHSSSSQFAQLPPSEEDSEVYCTYIKDVNRTACYFKGRLTQSAVKGSGSMLPLIQNNSITLSKSIKGMNAYDLKGRIISFNYNTTKKLIHRCVFAINKTTCIEAGDNNKRSWGFVNLDQIYSVVEYIILPQDGKGRILSYNGR